MRVNLCLWWITATTCALGVAILNGGTPPGQTRTLSNQEAALICGGEMNRQCGAVAGCSDAGPPFCTAQGFADCPNSTEKAPVVGAGSQACNVVVAGFNCAEGANGDCNIEYNCEWSIILNVCVRSSNAKSTTRAPGSCNFM
jgi:hypothetical protein